MKRWILISLVCALTLGQVSPVRAEEAGVEGGIPVLIVMDVQNAYLPYMDSKDVEPAVRMINATMAAFRAEGLPVIRVYHTDLEYGPATDSEAFRFVDSLRIDDGDPTVVKNYPSAFKKTDLEQVLHELNADTVFLTGLSATGCVLATYYDAVGLDFNTFMVKNGLISHRADLTDAVEEITSAVGYDAIRYMIADAGP